MDPKILAGIIGALVSTVGGALTLVAKLNKQYEAAKTTEEQVGSLGQYFSCARKIPLRVMWWVLFALCLLGLVMLVGGVAALVPIPALLLFASLLNYWPILVFAVLFITVCSYFDLPTRVILFFGSRMGNTQFDPGYINARWQLDEPTILKAMNYDSDNCSTLGVAILNLMITESGAPAEQAPAPDSVSAPELANYIFFGCVIEHWVHRLLKDKIKLNEMWKYLAWVARTAEHPFLPANISAKKAGFFEFLRGIGAAGAGGELPIREEISNATNHAADWLATEWRGDASRLAAGNIFKEPSPITLLDNLEQIDPFTGSDGLRRLYLKLSTRMRVWPKMDPGPFLYPFNSGIALLLLNSGCILTLQATKSIALEANEGFGSLVASAEDRVVRASLNHLKNHSDDAEMQAFSARVFKCAPADVDEWIFFDYVDLWLFTHTRRSCTVRTLKQPPTPCLLKFDGENCFCVRPQVEWRPGKNSLIKP